MPTRILTIKVHNLSKQQLVADIHIIYNKRGTEEGKPVAGVGLSVVLLNNAPPPAPGPVSAGSGGAEPQQLQPYYAPAAPQPMAQPALPAPAGQPTIAPPMMAAHPQPALQQPMLQGIPMQQQGMAPMQQQGMAPVQQQGMAPVQQQGMAPVQQQGMAPMPQVVGMEVEMQPQQSQHLMGHESTQQWAPPVAPDSTTVAPCYWIIDRHQLGYDEHTKSYFVRIIRSDRVIPVRGEDIASVEGDEGKITITVAGFDQVSVILIDIELLEYTDLTIYICKF